MRLQQNKLKPMEMLNMNLLLLPWLRVRPS